MLMLTLCLIIITLCCFLPTNKTQDQIKNLHGQLSDAERHAQQAFDETDQLRATIIELQLGGSHRTTPVKERPKSPESSVWTGFK